jgi:hypothetical protein
MSRVFRVGHRVPKTGKYFLVFYPEGSDILMYNDTEEYTSEHDKDDPFPPYRGKIPSTGRRVKSHWKINFISDIDKDTPLGEMPKSGHYGYVLID